MLETNTSPWEAASPCVYCDASKLALSAVNFSIFLESFPNSNLHVCLQVAQVKETERTSKLITLSSRARTYLPSIIGLKVLLSMSCNP
jgi:hypothetical protein